MGLKQCIRNLFKLGKKTETIDTKKIKIEFLGKEQEALLFVPYGMFINLPDEDILSLLYAQSAHEDSLIAMCTDAKNRDELEEKEVSFGIPTLKDRIKFSKDEKIIVTLGDVSGGDFAVRFNELETAFDELKDDYNNFITNNYNLHTHDVAGVQAGGSTATAAVTNNTGTESQADISDAKIENFEMPEKQ